MPFKDPRIPGQPRVLFPSFPAFFPLPSQITALTRAPTPSPKQGSAPSLCWSRAKEKPRDGDLGIYWGHTQLHPPAGASLPAQRPWLSFHSGNAAGFSRLLHQLLLAASCGVSLDASGISERFLPHLHPHPHPTPTLSAKLPWGGLIQCSSSGGDKLFITTANAGAGRASEPTLNQKLALDTSRDGAGTAPLENLSYPSLLPPERHRGQAEPPRATTA